MDFENIRLFAKVAELRSFSKAADETHVQRSLLSRRIAQLESELRVRLLQRTTRKVSVTPEGEHFLDGIRQGLGQLDRAIEDLRSTHGTPRGKVRVSTPLEIGQYLVEHFIADLFKTYPEVRLEWDFYAHERNPFQHGIDIIIRVNQPEEKSLVCREVRSGRFHAFISPRLKAAIGRRITAKDLGQLPWVIFTQDLFGSTQKALKYAKDGKTHEVRPKSIPFQGNNLTAHRHAIVNGLGVGLLPLRFGKPLVQQGSLLPLFPEFQWGEETKIYIGTPSRLYIGPKVRVVMDWLVKGFPFSSG